MQRLLLISLVSLAAGSTPCTAPAGIVPAVPEGLCFETVEPTNPSGVSIRQYKGPGNATFAQGGGNGAYPGGLQSAIASVLEYFSGANDDNENILTARTVPFLILPPGGRGPYWAASLEVSPTQFPDNFLIPRPSYNQGVSLTNVNSEIGLFAVFQYNSSGFPYIEAVEEACGVLQNSTLPSGYAINTTSVWTPTYAFYNGENDAAFTNECWVAVYAL